MHYYTDISPYIKDIELRQQPVIISVNEFTETAIELPCHQFIDINDLNSRIKKIL